MNNQKHNKGFTILWFALLLVILFQLFLLFRSQKPPIINNYIGKKGDTGQSIIGPQGISGVQGLAGIGLQGASGKDGITQIFNNTVNVPIPGPQGQQGDIGAQGRQEVLRVDQDCILQSQYDGDDGWTNLAQLPVPCEVQ